MQVYGFSGCGLRATKPKGLLGEEPEQLALLSSDAPGTVIVPDSP